MFLNKIKEAVHINSPKPPVLYYLLTGAQPGSTLNKKFKQKKVKKKKQQSKGKLSTSLIYKPKVKR